MRVAALCLGLGAVAGCLFDPVVPVGTPLACSVDADCPGGDVCAVGRCAPVEALRGDAASAVDVVVTPAVVGRGGVVDVTFAVAAPLSVPPVVVADVGRTAPLTLVPVDEPGTFHFRYTVDGSEAGGEATVTVTLTDVVGRVASATLGTFVVDLVAPSFTETTIVGATARAGSVIGADALLDAPADVTARAVATDGSTLPLDVSIEGLRVRARGVIDATVLAGPLTIVLAATDDAGNASGDVVVGVVDVDLDAPVAVVTATPAIVRPRDLVRFIVTVSEPVAAPVLRVGGEAVVADVTSGSVLSWSWFVPEGGTDTDGNRTVDVVADPFVDVAGNAGSLPAWTVAIDAGQPQVVVVDAPAAQARAGEVVTATFTFDEPVVDVTVEAQRFDDTFAIEVVEAAGTFRIAVPAESFSSEGRYDLVVGARDVVGNETRSLLASVVVDARPPTLLTATFTPASARLGSTVTLQSTFSEPLRPTAGGDGVVVDLVLRSATPGLRFVGVTGNTVTHTLAIDASTPALVTVDGYVAVDLAGNTTDVTSPIATLAVDNVAPVLTGLAASAARVARRPGSTIEIVGDAVDPDGSTLPEVSAEFAGRRQACVVAPPPSGLRCSVSVGAGDVDGTQPVVITARDEAGNTASGTVVVTLDGAGPVVLAAAFSAERARPGSAVQLTVLADEVLAEVELGLSSGVVVVAPAASSLSRAVVVPTSGTLELTTVRVVDDLGNARLVTLTSTPTVLVDGAPPGITGSAISTNVRRSDAARAGDVVIAEFDVELPLLEAPSFTFGGEPMAIIDDDGAGHFTARHVLVGTEVEGGTIITVTAVDDVGNVAFARSANTILVDLTPPTVIDGTVQVAVTPPPGAPVQGPLAVGAGGSARVSWLVGEPTVAAPTLLLGATPVGAGGLVVSGASITATLGSAALQNGAQTLRARHEDVVGNAATVDIAVLTADLVAPLPLSPAELALLLHERAPHGSITSETPFQQVRAVAGLVGRAGQTVSVAADSADNTRLASARVPAGPFILDVGRDRDDAFVQIYDDAGNRAPGPGARVRSEFIVGFHGKVAGSLTSNPHRLEARRHFTAVGVDPSAIEQDGDLVALRDNAPLVVDAAGLWQESGPQPPPSARSRVASTTHQDTTFMFGGCGEDGPVAETWVFDGRGWKAVFGEDDVIPPARCGAGLASDGNRVFLFGGEGFTGPLNDTWAFDGRNWKLLDLVGAPPTADMAMGFDPRSDELVIYGGVAGGVVVGDVYRAQPGGAWALAGAGPVASSAASATRDGVLVVVGGIDNRAQDVATIIGVDGGTVTTIGSLAEPSSRGCGLLVDGRVVVLGGVVGGLPVATALRVEGGVPTLAPELNLPSARSSLACGATGPASLAFGGAGELGRLSSDTVRFDGDAWRPIEAASDLPTPRSHAAFARKANATMVFGGTGVSSSTPSNEIWEFVEVWKPKGALPIEVERAGAACQDQRCLVVGGIDRSGQRVNRTQVVLDDGGTAELSNVGLTPRSSPAMAATVADGVLLFGGSTAVGQSAETCKLTNDKDDVATWDCAVLPGPNASAGAIMTSTNDAIVLYAAGQLWRFDKDRWIQIGTKDPPPARQFPALSVDVDTNVLWLHGGVAGATRFDDVWSYDVAADAWRPHLPADPFGAGAPEPRAAHIAHFDKNLGRVMVFGGEDATGAFGDMWDFLPSPDARAGIVVTADTTASPDATAARVLVVGDVVIDGIENIGAPGEPTATFPLVTEAGTLVIPIVARSGTLVVDAIEVRLIRP